MSGWTAISGQAEVRPCSVEDLPELFATWPSSADVHDRHFARQQAGTQTLVVAWEHGEAVASAVIRWENPDLRELQTTHADLAEIAHVQVRPDARGRGVGRSLMQGAEGLVRLRGGHTIGLGVGVDNPRAGDLYESLGYRRTGIVVRSEYRFMDENGTERHAVEWNEYMTLSLEPDSASPSSRTAGDADE